MLCISRLEVLLSLLTCKRRSKNKNKNKNNSHCKQARKFDFGEKRKHLQFTLWLYMWRFFNDNNGFAFNIYEPVANLVMMLIPVAAVKGGLLVAEKRELMRNVRVHWWLLVACTHQLSSSSDLPGVWCTILSLVHHSTGQTKNPSVFQSNTYHAWSSWPHFKFSSLFQLDRIIHTLFHKTISCDILQCSKSNPQWESMTYFG